MYRKLAEFPIDLGILAAVLKPQVSKNITIDRSIERLIPTTSLSPNLSFFFFYIHFSLISLKYILW